MIFHKSKGPHPPPNATYPILQEIFPGLIKGLLNHLLASLKKGPEAEASFLFGRDIIAKRWDIPIKSPFP